MVVMELRQVMEGVAAVDIMEAAVVDMAAEVAAHPILEIYP
jgi:hypothetical protein